MNFDVHSETVLLKIGNEWYLHKRMECLFEITIMKMVFIMLRCDSDEARYFNKFLQLLSQQSPFISIVVNVSKVLVVLCTPPYSEIRLYWAKWESHRILGI